MKDEAIFPNQAPLKDILSLELYEDGHYRDDWWLPFCLQPLKPFQSFSVSIEQSYKLIEFPTSCGKIFCDNRFQLFGTKIFWELIF